MITFKNFLHGSPGENVILYNQDFRGFHGPTSFVTEEGQEREFAILPLHH
jgi:hypothetical protein